MARPALKSSDLRLATVTTKFNQAEIANLDRRRGHYPRPAFLRAAGLGTQFVAPLPKASLPTASTEASLRLAKSWRHVQKTKGNLAQLNQHLIQLNQARLDAGPAAAAQVLAATLDQVQVLLSSFAADLEAARANGGA
jgi:hypothetical protein